tara:strand:+ start:594 stop:854 length:261 start_codon:yes stop_codon:yes gene_type:complete
MFLASRTFQLAIVGNVIGIALPHINAPHLAVLINYYATVRKIKGMIFYPPHYQLKIASFLKSNFTEWIYLKHYNGTRAPLLWRLEK